MKKYIRIFITFILVLSLSALSACDSGTASGTDSSGVSSDGTGSDGVGSDGVGSDGVGSDGVSSSGVKDPTQPAEIKVGFIYNGSVSGSSLNSVMENTRAELGELRDITTCYLENVLVQQFSEAVEILKNDGCSVIVAASNHFSDSLAAQAEADTSGTCYIGYGGQSIGGNLSNFTPALYQPAAVTGVVAAYNSVNHKIGMVIDNNAYSAYGTADAFALGVKETGIDTELSLAWAISSSNADTRDAIDALVADGNDIIFLYQTSTYGITYCEQIGVKVIGCAPNMPELAPNYYLTGYYPIIKNYIIDNIRKAQFENFRGTLENRGLRYGFAALVMLNSEICAEGTNTLTDAYYNLVQSGSAQVFSGEIRDTRDAVRVPSGTSLSVTEIMNIKWLVKSISSEENFSGLVSQEELVFSDFTIYE